MTARQLPLLLFLLFALGGEKQVQHPAHQHEHEAEAYRPAQTIHLEVGLQHPRAQHHHCPVDDQREQAQRQQVHRQRQELHQRPDPRVDKPQHHGNNQCPPPRFNRHPVEGQRGNQYRQR